LSENPYRTTDRAVAAVGASQVLGSSDIELATSSEKGGYQTDFVFALSGQLKTRDAPDRIRLDQPDFHVSAQ
jgi:hypothetical protein